MLEYAIFYMLYYGQRQNICVPLLFIGWLCRENDGEPSIRGLTFILLNGWLNKLLPYPLLLSSSTYTLYYRVFDNDRYNV